MTTDDLENVIELVAMYYNEYYLVPPLTDELLDSLVTEYYNKYGVGPEAQEWEEWFNDTPTFFDEEYNDIG